MQLPLCGLLLLTEERFEVYVRNINSFLVNFSQRNRIMFSIGVLPEN